MRNIETDILLVGGGIMSATLGVLLHQLDPTLNITMVEQLPDVALESSDALNNAGTGHAGYCEPVSYTHLDVYKRQPYISAVACQFISQRPNQN